MLGYLIFLFTFVPAVELAILIKVGQHIGVMNTLFLIVFTGILGAYLARLQGIIVLVKINKSLNMGVLPTDDMIDGLLIFCGGIVLLTPGLVTDTIGFLLLIPFTRLLIKTWVKRKFQKMMNDGVFVNISPDRRDDNFIDV